MSKNKKVEPNIEAIIKYPSAEKEYPQITASLVEWLSQPMEFHAIDYAKFSDSMLAATVEFDKDHMIYVLVPEDIFFGDLE